MKTVSIRLESKQDVALEAYAHRIHIDKSAAARKVIEEGLFIINKREALDMIRLKKWTVWKAAQYCGVSYRTFLPYLREENVPFPMSVEELEFELNENRGKQ